MLLELNFSKNLQVLKEINASLADKILQVKSNERFELFEKNYDIYDHKTKQFCIQNALDNLSFYEQNYKRHPFLIFFGIGNGMLIFQLLKNPLKDYICIIEPEIELLYIALHLNDFSQDLQDKRLHIYLYEDINFLTFYRFFEQEKIHFFVKTYDLLLMSNFYENYEDAITTTNSLCIESIKSLVVRQGNSSEDSFEGITQLLHNLPYQLANPSLKDLLKQRKGKIENAIIVSTGPSLMKQLPLLKEYANKASIICADSAYPILAKHNIKPDYVLSLERIEKTSEFFNNDFKEFDKGILFLLVSMVFPKTIEYLKRNNRQFMLVHRPLPFAQSLNMNDYGYLGTGMSVANMAYELAVKLGHKNIILIGQDLAYDENGKSHPKDYHYFKEDFEGSRKQGLFITAYGGNGKVETNKWWKVFKETFEKDIALMNPLGINTYNATEGGARIEGSIEKSFKELCENLLKENKVSLYLKKSIDKTSLQKTLLSHISSAENIIQKAEKLLEKVNESITNTSFQNLTHDINNFKILIAEIDNFKISIYNNKNPYFYTEISKPLFYHYECKISEIFIKNYDDDMDKMQKCVEYLNAGKLWLSNYIDILKIQNNLLKQASLN
ncbi:TPA: motility associated factor glycosyltransferase family protein [Campylobacter lari]|nr:motility associated factor glycosyltransferase family protein [Campylobacter lari]